MFCPHMLSGLIWHILQRGVLAELLSCKQNLATLCCKLGFLRKTSEHYSGTTASGNTLSHWATFRGLTVFLWSAAMHLPGWSHLELWTLWRRRKSSHLQTYHLCLEGTEWVSDLWHAALGMYHQKDYSLCQTRCIAEEWMHIVTLLLPSTSCSRNTAWPARDWTAWHSV